MGLAAALALGAGEAVAQEGVFQCPLTHPLPAFAGTFILPGVRDDPLPVGANIGAALTQDQLRSLYNAFRQSTGFIPTDPIECGFSEEDQDRSVVVRNPRITVTEDWVPAIYAWHQGSGDLVVYARSVDPNHPHDPTHFHPTDHGRYAARTSGDGDFYVGEESHGVWAEHTGEGRVGIDFRDLSLSTSGGDFAVGLYASQQGSYVWEDGAARRAKGAVIINVIESERDRANRARPLIGTRGEESDAIRAEYTRASAFGHIVVTVEGYTIATGGIVPPGPQIPNAFSGLPCGTEENPCSGRIPPRFVPALTGNKARGIYALHEGHGDIRVAVTDSHILTWGIAAPGIFADHTGKTETIINVGDGPVEERTEVRTGGGAVDIDVTGGEIRTAGADSIGIYGSHRGSSVRGAGGVAIDATGVTVATKGGEAHGVLAWVRQSLGDADGDGEKDDLVGGTGAVDIDVTGGALSTEGEGAYAVWGRHDHEGDITVTVTGDAATAGERAHAIVAEHRGSSGDVTVTVTGDAMTAGERAHAIVAEHRDQGSSGDVDLTVGGGAIATKGDGAHGVYAKNAGAGTVSVAVTDASVTTEGEESHGVLALQNGAGALTVSVTGVTVTAKGVASHGIEAHGGGDVTVNIIRSSVTAQDAEGAGVLARSVATEEGKGTVRVSVGAGSTVSGAASGVGIYSDGPRDLNVSVAGRVEGDVFHNGDGALILELPEGGVVTGTVHDPQNQFTVHGSVGRLFYSTGGVVTVARAGKLTGVEVELDGETLTQAIRSIAGGLTVTVQGAVGGDIRGDGTGDHRVTVEEGGTVAGTIRLAASTVDLDGTAGRVWLENGGTVTVGDTGLLTGVEVQLDGRTQTQALRSDTGDLVASLAGQLEGDVLALGSGTHRVTVEEGGDVSGTVHVATVTGLAETGSAVRIDGAVGRVRLDRGGALTVGSKGRIRGIGGNAVSGGPGDTRIDIVVDRHPDEKDDFAAFNRGVAGSITIEGEGRGGWQLQVRQVDGELKPLPLLGMKNAIPSGAYDVGLVDDVEGNVRILRLERDIAPRARVYEALPSVLLGMNSLPEFQDRMAAPRDAKGGWARVEAAGGDWKADASSSHELAREGSRVGLEYDHHRYGIQVGLDAPVGEDGLLGVSLHHRHGSAKVRDGGDIEPSGTGGGVSGTWSRNDVYVDVQAEATWYETDFSSSRRGLLKDGVKGSGWALGVETGRRIASGMDGVVLVPRAGLVHARVSLDEFEDAVGARMSLEEGRSLMGRLGVGVETKLNGSTESRLTGSLDVEHEFKDETKVKVSGTELKATAKATWLRLGLDGIHSWGDGRYALQGGVSYTEGGGGNYEIGGELALKVRF